MRSGRLDSGALHSNRAVGNARIGLGDQDQTPEPLIIVDVLRNRLFGMNKNDPNTFENLTFEDFKRMAADPGLSRHEKVGFPDSYRQGKEGEIFDDICAKLRNLHTPERTILEIGPGCSRLPLMLADLCQRRSSRLVFVDSEEMLAHLPHAEYITHHAGVFPDAIKENFDKLAGSVDVIIAYSVIQYVFSEGNLWTFLDSCLCLLHDGGEILFGDIPNISMRKRFFASTEGEACHRAFTGRDEKPDVSFNSLEIGRIDDSVVLSMLARARAQGFHAWVLPQGTNLPMANRREDVLIRKP